MHTTELVQYFSPQSSRKRDFVTLKHFSGKYGFHLCYMALRESVSDKNDNKELVAKMRKTGMYNGEHTCMYIVRSERQHLLLKKQRGYLSIDQITNCIYMHAIGLNPNHCPYTDITIYTMIVNLVQ